MLPVQSSLTVNTDFCYKLKVQWESILTTRLQCFSVCVVIGKRRVCKKVLFHQICTEEMPVFSLHIPTESYVGGSTNGSMNVFFFFCSFRGN